MPRYKDSPEVRAAKQERREKLRELLALMEVEDVRDLKSVFKEMVGEVLENGLEAELDDMADMRFGTFAVICFGIGFSYCYCLDMFR